MHGSMNIKFRSIGMLNVCTKCHTYDKTVSAKARLFAFLRLLYPTVLLNCKTRGLTFYFRTKRKKGIKS
jgi:hypothetical protein